MGSAHGRHTRMDNKHAAATKVDTRGDFERVAFCCICIHSTPSRNHTHRRENSEQSMAVQHATDAAERWDVGPIVGALSRSQHPQAQPTIVSDCVWLVWRVTCSINRISVRALTMV